MTRMDEAYARLSALIGEHDGGNLPHHANVIRDVFGLQMEDLAVLSDRIDDLLRYVVPPQVWDHEDVDMDEVAGISRLTFELGALFERSRLGQSEGLSHDD